MDLEIGKAVRKIRQLGAKTVCIQLPDGLKPKAALLQKEIEQKTGARVAIWAGTCFGACDTPLGLESLGFDLLIQWGHSQWKQK